MNLRGLKGTEEGMEHDLVWGWGRRWRRLVERIGVLVFVLLSTGFCVFLREKKMMFLDNGGFGRMKQGSEMAV